MNIIHYAWSRFPTNHWAWPVWAKALSTKVPLPCLLGPCCLIWDVWTITTSLNIMPQPRSVQTVPPSSVKRIVMATSLQAHWRGASPKKTSWRIIRNGFQVVKSVWAGVLQVTTVSANMTTLPYWIWLKAMPPPAWPTPYILSTVTTEMSV